MTSMAKKLETTAEREGGSTAGLPKSVRRCPTAS